MALYTLSELLQVIKDDTGLNDIPLPESLSDDALVKRLEQSALKEFSLRYPRLVTERFGDEWLSHKDHPQTDDPRNGIEFTIPKYVYDGATILAVSNVTPVSSSWAGEPFYPTAAGYSPEQIIGMVSDVQMVSAMGAQMSKSLSWEFLPPNKFKIYNGWFSGKYEIELQMTHDSSLATINPTAMSSFRELATLDLQEYIYNKYKRIQSLDVGVGSIELHIDEWQDSGSRKRELLRDWDQTANLDFDRIRFW